jgi:hypothetical protein
MKNHTFEAKLISKEKCFEIVGDILTHNE